MKNYYLDASAVIWLAKKENLRDKLGELSKARKIRLLVSPISLEEVLCGVGDFGKRESDFSSISFLLESAYPRMLAEVDVVHLRAGLEALGRGGRRHPYSEKGTLSVPRLIQSLLGFSLDEVRRVRVESIKYRRQGKEEFRTWFDDLFVEVSTSEQFHPDMVRLPFPEYFERHFSGQYSRWSPVPGMRRLAQKKRFLQSGIPTLQIIPAMLMYQFWARGQSKPEPTSIGLNDVRQLSYLEFVDVFVGRDQSMNRVAKKALAPLGGLADKIIGIDGFIESLPQ